MYLPGPMTAWSMSPIPQRCAQQLDYVPRRRASPLSHRPRGHQRVIRSARKGCSGKPAAKAHTPTWVIIGRAAIVVQRDGENRAFAWGGEPTGPTGCADHAGGPPVPKHALRAGYGFPEPFGADARVRRRPCFFAAAPRLGFRISSTALLIPPAFLTESTICSEVILFFRASTKMVRYLVF
jgi:hypothetical protein